MGILYPLGFEEQKNPALKDGIRHKIHNLRSLKQKTDGASRSSAQIENIKRQSLNINHPFFKPFSEKEDFKLVLEKFALAFALAEIQAKKNANSEGMISPNAFRTLINRFLEQLTDDE